MRKKNEINFPYETWQALKYNLQRTKFVNNKNINSIIITEARWPTLSYNVEQSNKQKNNNSGVVVIIIVGVDVDALVREKLIFIITVMKIKTLSAICLLVASPSVARRVEGGVLQSVDTGHRPTLITRKNRRNFRCSTHYSLFYTSTVTRPC